MKKEVELPEREELVFSVLWGIEENGENAICKNVVKKIKDEYLETVLRRINKIFFNGNKKKLIDKIKSVDI